MLEVHGEEEDERDDTIMEMGKGGRDGLHNHVELGQITESGLAGRVHSSKKWRDVTHLSLWFCSHGRWKEWLTFSMTSAERKIKEWIWVSNCNPNSKHIQKSDIASQQSLSIVRLVFRGRGDICAAHTSIPILCYFLLKILRRGGGRRRRRRGGKVFLKRCLNYTRKWRKLSQSWGNKRGRILSTGMYEQSCFVQCYTHPSVYISTFVHSL